MVSKNIAMLRQLFVAVITISTVSIFILFTWQSSYAFITTLPSLPRMHHLPRVLCWVNTHPANHMKKAVHVAATWGRWDMGFEFGRRCSRNRTTFHWICQWLHEIYIFMGSPEFYLSVSGVATNCCSWAQQRMRESEALLFPISPTDAPLFGIRLRRFKKHIWYLWYYPTIPGICLCLGAPQRGGRLVHKSRRWHLCHLRKPEGSPEEPQQWSANPIWTQIQILRGRAS